MAADCGHSVCFLYGQCVRPGQRRAWPRASEVPEHVQPQRYTPAAEPAPPADPPAEDPPAEDT